MEYGCECGNLNETDYADVIMVVTWQRQRQRRRRRGGGNVECVAQLRIYAIRVYGLRNNECMHNLFMRIAYAK